MSRILFDTNVLIDIATADANWLDWSAGQFRAAAALGPILINPIIYAELAPAFATQPDLDGWLDPAIFQRQLLPYAAGAAMSGWVYPRALSSGPVSAASDVRCCPSASKFSGASQRVNAASMAGHSLSMMAYQAVSRVRPL